ncbi:cytidylyltransferase domain-containing protein [Litorivivens sp.]|uniref:acylneuraminate cytidylyltransferase family protein n=1 Tax=Litorivivens sp. TaxID=2020868 RepID=UPI0035652770
MSHAIAVIPARGGSKRIPRKNIMDFFGKPMIAWTIEAAIQSGCFQRVVVSTDDEEIATVAREYGAEVPFLRMQNADDYSPVSQATLTALTQAESHWNESYQTVVQLMANCPIRGAADIRSALETFQKHDRVFQISCFRYGWMNPWWAARLAEDNKPEPVFSGANTKRSQDLETLYCPTGAIWIANVEQLRVADTFYGTGHVFEPVAWTSAVDIDDMDDLLMAKAVHLMLREALGQSF